MPRWTTAEEDHLRDNCGTMSVAELTDTLTAIEYRWRKPAAVSSKLWQMRLKAQPAKCRQQEGRHGRIK